MSISSDISGQTKMTIRYYPNELLEKIAPDAKLERLATKRLTVNRLTLSMFDDVTFIDKSRIKDSALGAVNLYRNKFERLKEQGLGASEAFGEAVNDNRLMIERVKNSVVQQVAEQIKDTYEGEFYIWLPSDAEEPDPEHQLKYGQKFQIGDGEMPGDRYGCRCGMQIIVKGSELEL